MSRFSMWATIALFATTPAFASMPGQPQDQDPVEQAAEGAHRVFTNVYQMQKRELQQMQEALVKATAKVGDWENYFRDYTTKKEKK